MDELRLLLSEKEAAKAIGMSVRWLQDRRLRGDGGPPWVRVGARIRYPIADLQEWVATRLRDREEG